MKQNLVLSALLVVAAACADNRSSVEITGRAAPSDAKTCKFSAEGDKLMGPGTLDVSFGSIPYSTVVYVKNNLADPTVLVPEAVTDAKAWRATAAKVRLNPESYIRTYGASPGLLEVTGTNVLPLDGATTPPGGSASQYIDLVDAVLVDTFAGMVPAGSSRRVILGVTLQGQTLDQARLDTAEWFFPLDVCNGCLQPVPACTDGQMLLANNCFRAGQDTQAKCE